MKLELSIEENDGHVTIRCTHKNCVWSWPVHKGSDYANGERLSQAIEHALNKDHDD